MSAGIVVLRVVASLTLVLLIGGSVWAQGQEAFWAGLIAIVKAPWGAVTFIDLYAGLVVVGVWIALLEPRRWTVPLWWALLMLCGNMATCVWLLWRSWKAPTARAAILGQG